MTWGGGVFGISPRCAIIPDVVREHSTITHAGPRSPRGSLPCVLSLGGDASLAAGQLISCRKIDVWETVLLS